MSLAGGGRLFTGESPVGIAKGNEFNSAPAKTPHLPLLAMSGIEAIWRIANASPLYAFGTKAAKIGLLPAG